MQRSTTRYRSTARWVIGVMLTCSLSPALADRRSSSELSIGGSAHYDDGAPIRGANVLLLEGCDPKPGQLPSFTPFARAVTDANGEFHFAVARKRAVIVELIGDRCDWFAVRNSIDGAQLKSQKQINVELVSKRDACPAAE